MIPEGLEKEHILQAIQKIHEDGIPKSRHSKKWSLSYEGALFPPKYVISVANLFASGEEWPAERFSGGDESNGFLSNLGYTIIAKPSGKMTFPKKSHSWEILSESVAVKSMDKSSFLHHGTGVPIEFRFFFGLELLAEGEKRVVTLVYKAQKFGAWFQYDAVKRRVRLFWHSDFERTIRNVLPEWYATFKNDQESDGERPELRFQRHPEKADTYDVDFIFPDVFYIVPEDMPKEDAEVRSEGAQKIRKQKSYVRHDNNRKRAIALHGTTCVICGFNFEDAYGPLGLGFIEIHHKDALHAVGEEHAVDPATDLVPVCPNCHRMIHRNRSEPKTIEQMIAIVQSR
jgi:5-methylcytosine-specific restriction protein A